MKKQLKIKEKEALEKAKDDYANNPTVTFEIDVNGELVVKGNPFNDESKK